MIDVTVVSTAISCTLLEGLPSAARRVGLLVACLTTALFLAGTAGARPALHDDTTPVVVTLTNSRLAFTPSRIPIGAVLFTVHNKSRRTRDFRIAGKRTAGIPSGKSASLPVALTVGGYVWGSSLGKAGIARLSEPLNVFEPCTNPRTTTVKMTVAQDQGGVTLSQTTIPCGTVTFVVTDTGTLPDSMQFFSGEASQAASAGTTPELQPGQSASVTVHFSVKGLAYYDSGDYPPAEPEFGGDYNEGGQLTIT